MKKTLSIPLQVLFILKTLRDSNFDTYLVGGAVRDILAENKLTDFDFCTNARPEQIQALFTESHYENDFGTVLVPENHLVEQMGLEKIRNSNSETCLPARQVLNSRGAKLIKPQHIKKIHESLKTPKIEENINVVFYQKYEVTTYRSKELYSNFRKPDSLEWGESIEEDLARRDFTINAMALSVSDDFLSKLSWDKNTNPDLTIDISEGNYELIDPYDGQADLEKGVIKAVGEAETRMREDALRMLRAIRFSVQLNMQIDELTFQAIEKEHKLLQHISTERIRDEFMKIIASDFPAEGVEILDEAGLLQYIIPELLAAKGVEQGGHHTTDVWTHLIDSLRYCPSPDPVVRIATLLHDIDKPKSYKLQNGNITFYNHEVTGARTARNIARRLKLYKEDIERVFILVRYHMFYYKPENTDASIRRFMRKVGLEHLDDILDLREADRLGSGARKTSWRLEEMKERMLEQLNQPMDVTDLAINGHDLMQKLGLKPGPQLGEILNSLLELVLEKPELNSREKLLEKARGIASI